MKKLLLKEVRIGLSGANELFLVENVLLTIKDNVLILEGKGVVRIYPLNAVDELNYLQEHVIET